MSKKEKELKTMISRRKFLATSGLAVGAAGMGLLTGCAGDDITDVYISTGGVQLPETWDGEADFVFIGYGGAAAMAAIHAAQESPSSRILILETFTQGGGSTAMSGGGTHLGGGTAVQATWNAAHTETADDFYKHVFYGSGEGADPEVARAFADHAKATFDALVAAGVQYDPFNSGYFNSPPTGYGLLFDNEQRPEALRKAGLTTAVPHAHFASDTLSDPANPPAHPRRGGSLWAALHATVSQLSNVEVIYSTKAEKLIVNDDGRVVGVEAAQDGAVKNYKASKAVLVACGGFINNADMRARFIPSTLKNNGVGPRDNGDGIKMGQAIGADLRLMGSSEDFYPTFMVAPQHVEAIAVKFSGERFAPEDLGGPVFGRIIARDDLGPLTSAAHEITEAHLSQDVVAWLVYDETLHQEMEANTGVTGNEYSAPTLAELAAKAGINAAILEDTVNRFNTYVVGGTDEQFFKDPATLRSVETAPFYAFPLRKRGVFTISCGGLRINDKAQVQKPDGSAIPGLYAAGSTAATINAQYYLAGGGTAGAFVFGRIAGLNMIEETAWVQA